MNSVVTITKAEIASSSTARPCPADFALGGEASGEAGGAALRGRTGDDMGKLL
ncbi:hypothetical protein HMP09_0812 [Sphingomonas sp. HMP9]|nr:hypothetical protein HMP09_0812 [Sphingomonas sp. HMP9]